jgi:hypothetical protein
VNRYSPEPGSRGRESSARGIVVFTCRFRTAFQKIQRSRCIERFRKAAFKV